MLLTIWHANLHLVLHIRLYLPASFFHHVDVVENYDEISVLLSEKM